MTDTKFIMEIGSNHNQDFDRLQLFLDEAKELNFWGIKLQLFDPERLIYNPSESKLAKLKKQVLPIEWLQKIKNKCQELNLKFICTPFYNEAVDILKPWIDCYKISSFDTARLDLIEACIKTKKMTFISNGLITPLDLFYLHAVLAKDDPKILRNQIVTMYCLSEYPASALDFWSKELQYAKLFGTKIGYSDHTVDQGVIIDAVINDAEYIEMHYDLMDGKGSESSYGHCWNKREATSLYSKIPEIIEKKKAKYEKLLKQTYNRADPSDGLRPMKELR